jgi:hypothetical protein
VEGVVEFPLTREAHGLCDVEESIFVIGKSVTDDDQHTISNWIVCVGWWKCVWAECDVLELQMP